MDKSESIAELAKALCKARKDLVNPPRNATNPFFKSKYADLSVIIDSTKDVLCKHGLVVSQLISPNHEAATVETVLMHESGEWISSMVSLVPKSVDPQGMGSAITYARRYALSAILGIASEPDDDANGATKPQPSSSQPRGDYKEMPISAAQVKRLKAMTDKSWTVEGAKAAIGELGFASSKDITRAAYDAIVEMMSKPMPDAYKGGE